MKFKKRILFHAISSAFLAAWDDFQNKCDEKRIWWILDSSFGNYVFPYPQIDWNNLDTRVVTEQNKCWYNLKNDEIKKKKI